MLDRNVQAQLKRSQVEAVEAVEGTMASFMRQYQSGRKTWVDVLNTQRELTELRYQLARIETDWLILSLRVAALIGHLDQLAGIEAI
jgi:adhesin transport system outer membrane protein